MSVELYIPRKCSATGRLIAGNERKSVQIAVANVNENGRIDGTVELFTIAGFIRQRGESDACLNRLFHEKNLLSFSL